MALIGTLLGPLQWGVSGSEDLQPRLIHELRSGAGAVRWSWRWSWSCNEVAGSRGAAAAAAGAAVGAGAADCIYYSIFSISGLKKCKIGAVRLF